MESVVIIGNECNWTLANRPRTSCLVVKNSKGDEIEFDDGVIRSLGLGIISNQTSYKDLDDSQTIDNLKPKISESNEMAFLPDEVKALFPHLVHDKAINYIGLIPLLVKEIQTLKKQIAGDTSETSSVQSANITYDIVYSKEDEIPLKS